jgi:diaminopimelate epimerase
MKNRRPQHNRPPQRTAQAQKQHRSPPARGLSQSADSLRLPFTKMHGLGNDFVVIDLISNPVQLSTEQIRQLGNRNRGIGFDQLLIIDAPQRPDADFSYRIFNADGSEVEHCGNGARCFARYVLSKGLIARSPIRVQTRNRMLELNTEAEQLVTVDMGAAEFNPAALPFNAEPADVYTLEVAEAPGKEQLVSVSFFAVSVGNPHIVLLTDNCDTAPVNTTGAVLCTHPAFPNGVNVGFMEIVDRATIRLRVFERGVGETEACGTGTCAAVVCGIRAGLLDTEVRAILKGGELKISWQGADSHILMTGPAETVFEGTVVLDQQP